MAYRAAFHPRERMTAEQINVWRTRFQQLVVAGRTDEIPSTRLSLYTSLVTPFDSVETTTHEMLCQLLLDGEHYHEALEETGYALCLLKDDTALLYAKRW